MRKLFYLPLEPYPERYTIQLSAAKTGWLERNWIKEGVDYYRVEGKPLTSEITKGSVLDANGRGYWACSQIMEILRLLNTGEITSDDCLYFDDFWHPGIEALPYSFHLTGIKPKMFAMLHAQSIDPYDFTYPMRNWMRPLEVGIGRFLEGIFVASTCLKDLCIHFGVGTVNTVHICGLPYSSEEVKEHFPQVLPGKKKQVVFPSRWDTEKCPFLFLEIMGEVMKHRNDIQFVVTTSAKRLRSNEPDLLVLLNSYLNTFPQNLTLKEGLTKEEYYYNLLESRIQLNTADQDFVSWTLLESTTCGCIPLFPYYLSFPEALGFRTRYMYGKNDARHAATKIMYFIDLDKEEDMSWVYKKFDSSWKRMLQVMEGRSFDPLFPRSERRI